MDLSLDASTVFVKEFESVFLVPRPDLQRDMTAAEQIERGWIDADGNVIGPGFKTPSQGAAIAPLASPEGSMEGGGVRDYAINHHNAERLWQVSAHITGVNINRSATE
ncbi:hypothetical protein [[Mycobacterium] fortunisiensis]|uniref:hypothetical protein n=1 Tax=[Mycobacterium] fortunisiensis TaxID=2600579 RepID=UPI001C27E74C|nr:hypothetical protein [[Mycobacterium] fortunisiensis]